MTRIATRPYTFSNEITVPQGTLLAAAARAVHFEETVYNSPKEFQPFRFVGSVARFVTPSTTFIPWGTGKHTWRVPNPCYSHLIDFLPFSVPADFGRRKR